MSRALVLAHRPVSSDRLLRAFFEGKSPHTLRAYELDLQDFSRFLARTLGTRLDVQAALWAFLQQSAPTANELVLNYKHDLAHRKLAPGTVNRRLAALKSFVKIARMLGAIAWTLEVRGVQPEVMRDTRGPSVDHTARLLAHVEAQPGPHGRRDYAMFRLMTDLGLRVGEVVGLDVADVEAGQLAVHVRGKGKRGKARLELPEASRAAIGAWLAVRGAGDGPLFTHATTRGWRLREDGGRLVSRSLYRLVRNYGRAVGLVLHPHGLRHTAITTAVEAANAHGIGLDEVRQFSRHKNINTLLIYRDQLTNRQGQLATLVSHQLTKKPGGPS